MMLVTVLVALSLVASGVLAKDYHVGVVGEVSSSLDYALKGSFVPAIVNDELILAQGYKTYEAILLDSRSTVLANEALMREIIDFGLPLCIHNGDKISFDRVLKAASIPAAAYMEKGFYLFAKRSDGRGAFVWHVPSEVTVTKTTDQLTSEQTLTVSTSELMMSGVDMLFEFLETRAELEAADAGSTLIPDGTALGFYHLQIASQRNQFAAENSDMNEGKGVTLHPYITYGLDVYAYKDVDSRCSMITVHRGTTSPLDQSMGESMHNTNNGRFWFHTNTYLQNQNTNSFATVSQVTPEQTSTSPVDVVLQEQLQLTINDAETSFTATVQEQFNLPDWGITTSNEQFYSFANLHQVTMYDASIYNPADFGNWWQKAYGGGDSVNEPPEASQNPLDWIFADLWSAKNGTAAFHTQANSTIVGLWNTDGSGNGHHMIQYWWWAQQFSYSVDFGSLKPN